MARDRRYYDRYNDEDIDDDFLDEDDHYEEEQDQRRRQSSSSRDGSRNEERHRGDRRGHGSHQKRSTGETGGGRKRKGSGPVTLTMLSVIAFLILGILANSPDLRTSATASSGQVQIVSVGGGAVQVRTSSGEIVDVQDESLVMKCLSGQLKAGDIISLN